MHTMYILEPASSLDLSLMHTLSVLEPASSLDLSLMHILSVLEPTYLHRRGFCRHATEPAADFLLTRGVYASQKSIVIDLFCFS